MSREPLADEIKHLTSSSSSSTYMASKLKEILTSVGPTGNSQEPCNVDFILPFGV